MEMLTRAVWVVDDDADDGQLVQFALNELYPPVAVTLLTTFDALLTHMGQAGPLPIVLLVDLNMPGVSGFEILHYLRRRAEFATLPIVILTDSEAVDAQRKAFSLGATEYLVKPFAYAELRTSIQQLVIRWSSTNEPVRARSIPIETHSKG